MLPAAYTMNVQIFQTPHVEQQIVIPIRAVACLHAPPFLSGSVHARVLEPTVSPR